MEEVKDPPQARQFMTDHTAHNPDRHNPDNPSSDNSDNPESDQTDTDMLDTDDAFTRSVDGADTDTARPDSPMQSGPGQATPGRNQPSSASNLQQLAAAVLAPLGYELLEVQVQNPGKRPTVVVRIDRHDEQPVSIEDLAKASRAVGTEYDRHDPITGEIGRAHV